MIRNTQLEEKLKKINLNEALESHTNHCTLLAVNLLGLIVGRDAEEYPSAALMALVNSKKLLPMKDLQDATGLRKRDYLAIFEVKGDRRYLKSDNTALAWMMDHMKRKDLLPHQRAISELIWKRIRGKAMDEFRLTYYHMTDGWLEDDFSSAEVFQYETYEVTADELNEAVRLYFIHIYDLQPREAETC